MYDNKYFTTITKNNSYILLHIPHSSLHFPKQLSDDYFLSKKDLEKDSKIIADMYTCELFEEAFKKFGGIRLDVNRLFLDVERFRDDEQEPMSKIGMGVLYTKTSDLKPLRSLKYKEEILKIYDKYHEALDDLVENKLKMHGKCLIIDCHSFPSVQRAFMLDDRIDCDVCIGYESFHCDKKTVAKIKYKLGKMGYKIYINKPYSGSIVPNKYFQKDSNVKSIMLELNRKIYMDDVFNFEKNDNFYSIKQSLEDTLNTL